MARRRARDAVRRGAGLRRLHAAACRPAAERLVGAGGHVPVAGGPLRRIWDAATAQVRDNGLRRVPCDEQGDRIEGLNVEVPAGMHHEVSHGRVRRQGKPVPGIVDVERGPVNLDRELREVEIEIWAWVGERLDPLGIPWNLDHLSDHTSDDPKIQVYLNEATVHCASKTDAAAPLSRRVTVMVRVPVSAAQGC